MALWDASRSFLVDASRHDYLRERRAEMLDTAVCTDVAKAVQLLNIGDVKCSGDIVVVWSAARNSYFALYKENLQREIADRFAPPDLQGKLAPVPPARECGYPAKSNPQPPIMSPAVAANPPILALDFDHTITSRHFYKVLLWGFYGGRVDGAVHAELPEFAKWCQDFQIPMTMPRPPGSPNNDETGMHRALDYLDSIGKTSILIRTYFLGGEPRITMLSEWLRRMAVTARPVIITAGRASAVARAVATAVPEWTSFFGSENCIDVGHSRWSDISSTSSKKLLIIRDRFPASSRILLVDDSLRQDWPAAWVLTSTRASVYDGLTYEAGGMTALHLADIEKRLLEC